MELVLEDLGHLQVKRRGAILLIGFERAHVGGGRVCERLPVLLLLVQVRQPQNRGLVRRIELERLLVREERVTEIVGAGLVDLRQLEQGGDPLLSILLHLGEA